MKLKGLGLALSLTNGYFNSFRWKTEPLEERYKLLGENKRLRGREEGEKRKKKKKGRVQVSGIILGRTEKKKKDGV